MHLDELLTAAVLLLGASAAAITLFQRAGFGSVLGLLVVGIVLGPHTAGPVVNIGPIAAAAELGVVFLLFVIGLELEPGRIWAMRRQLFGLGTLQVVITGLVLAAVGLANGRPWQAALVLGFGLALSSTAFVLQLLTERDELATEHGRAALAILLLQDMAVIPLLALVPLLAPGSDEPDAASIGMQLALIAGTLAAIIALGRIALPLAFTAIARQRSAEAFAVLAILAVLSAAWLAAKAGLSPALGAFVVGVLLSGSPFHHQVAAEVTPFKGFLLGLFFISVGMSVDLSVLLERWREIVALVLALILLKGLVIALLCRLFSLDNMASLRTSLLLIQGGEFGFVLFGAAAGMGVMGAQLHTTALLVISLSMAATPFLVRLGDRLIGGLPGPEADPGGEVAAGLQRHVVIAGYGRVGRAIAEMLEETGIPFVVIEHDLRRVPSGPRERRRVFYGDGSDPRVLRSLAADRAAALVVTLDKPVSAERVVATARALYPELAIIARAHDADASVLLKTLGATVVVPETLELSLIIAEAVLRQLAVPDDVVDDAAELVRRYHVRETR
jgi:glutathione-regulated potassium-efflux system ancillary protein KefC